MPTHQFHPLLFSFNIQSRRDIISPNLDFMGELTDFETRLLRDRELEKRPVISTAPAISSALSHGPVA